MLRSLHARYKLEGAESIYIRRLPLCDNFIIPLDIVCQVYSSTKPSTLRPLLAAPVNGVNLVASSASKSLTSSISSGVLNTAASVNSSNPNTSSYATSLPPLACSSCILGTSTCAA